MKQIITIASLLISYSLMSQTEDVIEVFSKVNQNYTASDFDISYTAVVYETPVTGEELGKGRIARLNEGYYVQFGDNEMVYVKSGVVAIDHVSKRVHYLKSDKPKNPTDIKQMDFLSQINLADTVYLRKAEAGVAHYRLEYSNNVVESIEMAIDLNSFYINKMVYHYQPMDDDTQNDFHKMELNYTINNIEEGTAELTELKKYLSKSRGVYTYLPNPSYRVSTTN